MQLQDPLGRTLGRRWETCRLRADSDVSSDVLRLRQDKAPETCQAPENVLVFQMQMELDWIKVSTSYKAVDKLLDTYRLDLRDFCR